ncbi:MAG: Lrp/AsnC family transcriptional regulator [Leptolyngbya sp.]|jgi:Lrp/AsnC family leucine-responsive transcriptional regulator|uniref:Lrp/AsnC family transcriptional regulator n=1 Tax=Shackletoniella antarctica TaxID=268115 RepID=A0A2W4VSG4_9CYAN|nr:MAG: Lrp/AsnC family transcriptional regulator [Shackletoniella antarctica]PZV09225.1 MAG: Lrp/AsnC family transcriptional regulator [Leptolyngbya sp.]
MELNDLDIKTLSLLCQRGRMTWAELAGQLGLSAPAAADRVKRLEERGLITGYSALLDAEALGLNLTAFIAVTLDHPRHRAGFLAQVNASAEILECHHVTGDDDYLLKVRCCHTRALEALITDQLKDIEGVAKTRTLIVLSTVKETQVPPLDHLSES